MKIIKYKKLPGNKYKITLDNNDIILYEDIIIKNMILLKKEIKENELKQYLDERKDTNPALFVGNKKPYNRLSQRAVQKIFSNLKKDLGLNIPLHPHILRHTFATKLAATADITVVQKLLGHSSINTTMVYAEINDDKVNYQYKASKL